MKENVYNTLKLVRSPICNDDNDNLQKNLHFSFENIFLLWD